MSADSILFNEKPAQSGLIAEVILNRPKVLNALSLDMCQRFGEQLNQWKTNDDIQAVIVKGRGDRGFCAGGDIRALYENRTKFPERIHQFFYHEYRLNTFIHHFPKPYFAFIHHITMGGGAGVSIHGSYRIATENLMFAMPETKIGFYPDIGAHYFLNQCPGYTGLYLALTGNHIDANTAYTLGLVTHIIPDDKFAMFESTLYKADTFSEEIINPFTTNSKDAELDEHIDAIDDCFSANSLDEIFQRLNDQNDWTRDIANQLAKRCPTSLKITFESFHRAKKMSFDDIMQMNFDVTQQFLTESDFFEGVRSAIIDKDQSPKWQPEISDDQVKRYFAFKGKKLL